MLRKTQTDRQHARCRRPAARQPVRQGSRQTQLGIGINFADGGQSFVAGVREIGVAALPVVEPLRLNRGTSFWNEGSCLPDGDHCHGV